jgi:putative endopeptidase
MDQVRKTILSTTIAFAALCPALATAQPAASVADLTAAPRMGPWGFDSAGQDKSVAPGQDFYRFTNGAYLSKLEIPGDRTSWGSFIMLRELSDARSHALIEKIATDASAAGEAAQIGRLYRSFMDEQRVNALGAKPIMPFLDAVRAATTRERLVALMGRSDRDVYGSIFALSIGTDAKNPTRYALLLNQAGLGLPDRDYYLEASFAPQRAAYERYVEAQLAAVNWPSPEAAAKAIVAMETEIAKVSWTKIQERDDEKMYNGMSVAELAALAPAFPWKTFMAASGVPAADRVVVGEKTAFAPIAAIFARTSIPTLQAWQAFRVVDQTSPYLSKSFVDAQFDFRSKALGGQPTQRPRWKRGVSLVGGAMGEAMGKLYVATYFPPESKAQMEQLVANLKLALGARIEQLRWMSPATREAAQAKLAKFGVKIGYPGKWRDYSTLEIGDDLVTNIRNAKAFEWAYRLGRIDQPVDKAEWAMLPQTVNAQYSPTENDITFPAAILQPPFFDPEADPAVNYGAIGAVIGHEMIHGFDDEGRLSDGSGMLRNWWTDEDAAKFKAQTERLGEQYSAFEPIPGVHLKGGLTMGENIADLGGILVALDAYHASLAGAEAPVIDGLSGDQRFFLAFEQIWRAKTREDTVRQLTVSDPHSPPEFRGDGTVRNVDAWYDAWGIKPGDAMYIPPESRVRIW